MLRALVILYFSFALAAPSSDRLTRRTKVWFTYNVECTDEVIASKIDSLERVLDEQLPCIARAGCEVEKMTGTCFEGKVKLDILLAHIRAEEGVIHAFTRQFLTGDGPIRFKRNIDFENTQPDDGESEPACDKGSEVIGDYCVSCPPGYYEKAGKCVTCDYDSYAFGASNTECTPCGVGKMTIEFASTKPEDCIGTACVIPSNKAGYYTKDNVPVYAGERVGPGIKLAFECYGYYADVEDIITCTGQGLDKTPESCAAVETLTCYDSCYRESEDDKVTFLNGNGTKVDTCSPVVCGGSNDECVTIESSSEGKTLQNFKCSDTSKADATHCSDDGLLACTVSRCSDNECNKPASGARGLSSMVFMLVSVLAFWLV